MPGRPRNGTYIALPPSPPAVVNLPHNTTAAGGGGVYAQVSPESHTVLVKWTPPSTNGAHMKYGIVSCTTPGRASGSRPVACAGAAGSYRFPCVNGKCPLSASVPIEPATLGLNATFAILFVNDVGQGPASSTPPLMLVSCPSEPKDVVGDGFEGGDALVVVVAWAPPDISGGVPLSVYRVGIDPSVATQVVDASRRTVTVPGLNPGVQYSFNVTAVNELGLESGVALGNVAVHAPLQGAVQRPSHPHAGGVPVVQCTVHEQH